MALRNNLPGSPSGFQLLRYGPRFRMLRSERPAGDGSNWVCRIRYFGAIPEECVPTVGQDGEIWRHQQQLIQLPIHDTDSNKCSDLSTGELEAFKRLDDKRLKMVFDIGEVVECPDFGRPDECPECGLTEHGTHWAYCSRFIEPDLEKRAKQLGIRTAGLMDANATSTGARKKSASSIEEFYGNAKELRSIKTMKRGKPKVEENEEARGVESFVAGTSSGSSVATVNASGGKCHGSLLLS